MKRCPHADVVSRLYFDNEGSAFCVACWNGPRGLQSSHMYTGRKIWLGSEVYGKKLGSDELRADTERDLLKKNHAPWMEERIKNRGLDESKLRHDSLGS